MRASVAAAQREGTAPGLQAFQALRVEDLSELTSVFLFLFPGPGDNIHSIFVSYGSCHAPTSCLFWCPDVKQTKKKDGKLQRGVSIKAKKKRYLDTGPNIAFQIATTTWVVGSYPGDTLPLVCLEYEWGDHFLHIDPLRGKTDNICC